MIPLLLWRKRLEHLDSQLKAEPDAMPAWRWRGEAKVLRFLLRRYGEQPNIVPVTQRETTWISWLALDAARKWPVLRPDLRIRLLHIARLNREAHPRRANTSNFWAQVFHPMNDFWLEIELRGIECAAIQRERERNFAERMRQSRLNKKK